MNLTLILIKTPGSFLKEIYLRGNNLGLIPEELCSLPVLEILDLSENRLNNLPE